MTQGTRWLRCALLALLALALLSGGSLATGDLFDDDYRDCPHKTRLRDGQIADLTVARDAEEADEVNVSWAATDPATWGLGSNAYSTSLVVLLDDDNGNSVSQTLPLGTRKTTFEKVATGTEVTVQMAIVVDTAEGDYLISDILEASIHQSLTAPSFYTDKFWRVVTVDRLTTPDVDEMVLEEVSGGTFYYVGYNEHFGDYKATGLTTYPSTPRLRIGLAHGGEDDDAREAVEFEAYRIRITDSSGDVVPEGNDVTTVGYQSAFAVLQLRRLGSIASMPENNPIRLRIGRSTTSLVDNARTFSNVRINDGGNIQAALHTPSANAPFEGLGFSPDLATHAPIFQFTASINTIFAMAPNEHRDFPDDVLVSDETYTLTAWAVNDAGVVISPVASLKLRPVDTASSRTNINDYTTPADGTTVSDVVITEFTVLK